MKVFPAMVLILTVNFSWGKLSPANKISKKDQKFLKKVSLPSESLGFMEQHLKKREDYDGKSPYLVQFLCSKPKKKKKVSARDTKCKLVEYTILKKTR